MAEFFMGQVMMGGFNFAPKYFALANGQLLPINQNTALFSLLGTYYGGNGVSNFALPNLQGRVPVGQGSSVDPSWQPSPLSMGSSGGAESVTLLANQLPPHTHGVAGSSDVGRGRGLPGNSAIGASRAAATYGPATNLVPLQGVTSNGGTQAHTNIQPFAAVTFCIALSGIFPSRN